MSWSYDATLSTPKDKVRFYVQDTDSEDQLLSNEEIDAALTSYSNNVFRAGATAARAIALQLGRRPSVRLAIAGLDSKAQYEQYMAIARDLEARAGLGAGGSATGKGLFAGGISKADMDTRKQDSDRPTPAFTTKTHSP